MGVTVVVLIAFFVSKGSMPGEGAGRYMRIGTTRITSSTAAPAFSPFRTLTHSSPLSHPQP